MDLQHEITVASITKVRQKSADESESLIALEKEMEEADNEEGNIEEDIDDIIDDNENPESDK